MSDNQFGAVLAAAIARAIESVLVVDRVRLSMVVPKEFVFEQTFSAAGQIFKVRVLCTDGRMLADPPGVETVTETVRRWR